MELGGYYKVTVTVAVEQEDGKKPKKHKEVYIVSNCGDMDDAIAIVKKEFGGCTDEWWIENTKLEKIDAVLDAKDFR